MSILPDIFAKPPPRSPSPLLEMMVVAPVLPPRVLPPLPQLLPLCLPQWETSCVDISIAHVLWDPPPVDSTFQMEACLLELTLRFDLLSPAVSPTPVLRCVSLTPQVMLSIVLR